MGKIKHEPFTENSCIQFKNGHPVYYDKNFREIKAGDYIELVRCGVPYEVACYQGEWLGIVTDDGIIPLSEDDLRTTEIVFI